MVYRPDKSGPVACCSRALVGSFVFFVVGDCAGGAAAFCGRAVVVFGRADVFCGYSRNRARGHPRTRAPAPLCHISSPQRVGRISRGHYAPAFECPQESIPASGDSRFCCVAPEHESVCDFCGRSGIGVGSAEKIQGSPAYAFCGDRRSICCFPFLRRRIGFGPWGASRVGHPDLAGIAAFRGGPGKLPHPPPRSAHRPADLLPAARAQYLPARPGRSRHHRNFIDCVVRGPKHQAPGVTHQAEPICNFTSQHVVAWAG